MYVLPVFFLLLSCGKNKANVKVETLPFETNFDVGFFGNIQVKTIDTTDYFFFSELQSRNKVAVFDESGTKKVSFELGSLVQRLGEKVKSAKMINLNHFVFITRITNKIIGVNANAELLYEKKVPSSLGRIDRYKHNIVYVDSNEIVLGIETNAYDSMPPNPTMNDWKKANYQSFFDYKIGRLNNSKDSIELGLNNLYSRFLEKDQFAGEGMALSLDLKEKQVLCSAYTDSVYLLEDFKLKNVLKINSNFFSTAIPKVRYQDYFNHPSKFSKILIENDYILDGVFSPSHNVFFIVVRGAKNKEGNFPFSIVAVDSTRQQVDERKMNELEYYTALFSSEKNTYLLKKSPQNKNNTITFDKIVLK